MSGPRRLLVIDDEADFASLVVTVASQMGYAATAAGNAGEFQRLFLASPPDVIVLDMVMPDQDGIELVRWLLSRGCRARIVIVSGFNPDYAKSAKTFAEIGGQLEVTVLRKPVKLEELRANLR
jgi:DNA-binding response OmpR family regulator